MVYTVYMVYTKNVGVDQTIMALMRKRMNHYEIWVGHPIFRQKTLV